MISLGGARRRTEEFAAAVDGRGSARPDLAGLVDVVTTLRDHAPVAPRPEFTAALRDRLLAEADAILVAATPTLRLPVRRRSLRERRLVAAAAAFVVLGGTAGVANAAQHALPGQALYPVKRGMEQVGTALSTSPHSKGRVLLDHAGDRITEVQGLLADGSPTSAAQVPSTIRAFTSAARDGSDLLFTDYRDNGDESSVDAVRTFAATSLARLNALAPSVPDDARPDLAEAAVTLQALDRQASVLCPTCEANLPPLNVSQTFQAAAAAISALNAFKGVELNNSHPVALDPGAVSAAAGAPGAGASTAPPPTSSLPGVGGSTGSPDPNGTVDDITKTVKDLTDTVTGLTKTLLPDPTASPSVPNLLP